MWSISIVALKSGYPYIVGEYFFLSGWGGGGLLEGGDQETLQIP